jgi:hypothetical protein
MVLVLRKCFHTARVTRCSCAKQQPAASPSQTPVTSKREAPIGPCCSNSSSRATDRWLFWRSEKGAKSGLAAGRSGHANAQSFSGLDWLPRAMICRIWFSPTIYFEPNSRLKTLWPAHRDFVGKLEPVDVLGHVRAEPNDWWVGVPGELVKGLVR